MLFLYCTSGARWFLQVSESVDNKMQLMSKMSGFCLILSLAHWVLLSSIAVWCEISHRTKYVTAIIVYYLPNFFYWIIWNDFWASFAKQVAKVPLDVQKQTNIYAAVKHTWTVLYQVMWITFQPVKYLENQSINVTVWQRNVEKHILVMSPHTNSGDKKLVF